MIVSAVILLGMAKKAENKWRQLSLLSQGKEAVRLQRAGETVNPSEMYFGSARCMATMFDMDRMMISDSEKGWFKDDQDVLVIVDTRPSKMALLIGSQPCQRFFTEIAANVIDGGAKSSQKKVVGDGFAGIIDVVEMDGSVLPIYELGKGDKDYSPYFVFEHGVDV